MLIFRVRACFFDPVLPRSKRCVWGKGGGRDKDDVCGKIAIEHLIQRKGRKYESSRSCPLRGRTVKHESHLCCFVPPLAKLSSYGMNIVYAVWFTGT